jgi:YVTN family beta-propeller protein
MQRLLKIGAAIGLLALVLVANRAYSVDPVSYYFNNAVDQSPSELGNYWLDYDATDPALTLPDYNNLDELHILPGATYDGHASFYGSGGNEGTVTGNATYYDNGPGSDNIGTIQGTKSIVYQNETTTNFNFTTDDPWIVVADGVELDITEATYDNGTTFTVENSGSYIYTKKYRAYADTEKIYIEYRHNLDTSSVPSTGDFAVSVNGEDVSVSSVAISGATLSVQPNVALDPGDAIVFSYTPGATTLKSLIGLQEQAAIVELTVEYSVPMTTGFSPTFSRSYGTKLFVLTANESSSDGKVTVIDTENDTVLTTIALSEPGFNIIIAEKKLYVALDGTIKVYSTDSYAEVATITVGVGSSPLHVVGQKVYVGNYGENTVSVIDTNSDTVTETLTVGTAPAGFTQVGTYLYVNNHGSNSISVIDTSTDTIADTITSVSYPYYSVAIGDTLYVANNSNTNTLTIIDTTTNTQTGTIGVAAQPYFILAVGKKIYVPSSQTGNISVVDTDTNTVIETLTTTGGPNYMTVIGNTLYVTGSTSGSVDIVDTTIDEIVSTITTDSLIMNYGTAVADKVYVGINNRMLVLDNAQLPHAIPALLSFTSTAASGTYTTGQTINITATFDRNIKPGSTMTVALNSGGSATLTNVSGSTLSGTYTVGSGHRTPDLAVSSVTSASVTDFANTITQTAYDIPSSQGSFVAENSFITRNIGDSKNIVIGGYVEIEVGDNPYQASAAITVDAVDYSYVANQGDGTVSVIRLSDNTVVDTITVGDEPYGLSATTVSGTIYMYVANTGSDTVSVIDTSTNTVTATVAVGLRPYYATTIGTEVYVTNGASNTVSVIDATNNTVTATIPVGAYPRGIKAHGTDLYVANFGDQNYSGGNSITVIDSTDNSIADTILLPGGSEGPRGVIVLDDIVYVANYRSHNVSVIDTATNTVVDTIDVGNGPRGTAVVGTKVYIENFDDGTISIIDSSDNTVDSTVVVGHSPAGMGVYGTDIYVTRFQDNLVSILDTTTGLLETIPVEEEGGGGGGGGSWGSSIPVPIPVDPNAPIVPPVVPPIIPPATENPTGPENTSGSADFSKTYPNLFAEKRNLKAGMTSKSILELQKYLNSKGFVVAKVGAGSPGKETSYFGTATKAALVKFQDAHAKEILIPVGLKKGTGIFGPSTKKYILLNP